MDCLFWNCRGANKPNFRRSIRYILKKFHVDILALFETHAEGDRASRICQNLGFANSYRVDAVGHSGGIWLLWRTEVGVVSVVEATDQFIHVKVENNSESMHLIAVYAAPTASRRSGLWEKLKTTMAGVDDPVIIGGDFNTIVRLDERSGGNGCLSADSVAFGDWINALNLIDMGFKGSRFTWRRGKLERNLIAKRLDRILCCPHARLKWQEAIVTHLPMLASDHTPLYLQLCPLRKGDPRRRPFRFEAAWLEHEGFKELLTQSWNRELTTPAALDGLRIRLKRWNHEVFGDVHKRKEKLITEIKIIQDLLDVSPTDELLNKEDVLCKELDIVLAQEELIWFQKSREKWIGEGDRNTKFFHVSTIIRRRKNRVESLKNETGQWTSDTADLETLAVTYYRRLYSLTDVDQEVEGLNPMGFPALTTTERRDLDQPFTVTEVEKSVRSMGKFKAPGPDGYQPVFYQQCWDVVGESVSRFVLGFFESNSLPEGTNDALVVLLAKVMKPETIMQFRPISLCNVLFKTITKAMVMRLKRVMPKLIGPAQASFIPGRLSTDNIIVVQEAVHSMRKKKGRKGWMMLKLDLEKAYDRIRWDFLEDSLTAAGLSSKWRGWIMKCVVGPSMTLLWNGEKTEPFKPERGLRQGDPLSPYLFVLCLERLCHQIELSIASKEWKPICLSRGGPQLSHICFADDLILFAEASVTQIRVVRKVLERFCIASGQKVSLEKSKIFFSENVSRELAKQISDESGIQATRDLGKYLGMPILHKRINKDTFGEVLARVSSRLSGWRGRFLSLAGRITLTRSVLSSLPVHTMTTISLPQSILEKLDRMSRSFIWGSSEEKKKQHLVAWDRVCAPKSEGGLGIRLAKPMNRALLAKVGWRLIQDKDSLWTRVLRGKYRVGNIRDPAWLVPKGVWSSTWRSVATGLREVVIPGLKWVIGNGREVLFWQDKWLNLEPLSESFVGNISESQREARVRDLWKVESGWDWQHITPYISENTKLQLASLVVDTITGVTDRACWGGCLDGKFTVSSAYKFLTRDEKSRQSMGCFFERIWKVRVPERVRVFLWLTGQQALMTNMERFRRHLSNSGVCSVCKMGEETIIHILRDCPAMSGVWNRLVPPRLTQSFFRLSLLEWLFHNLGDTTDVRGCPWATLFAMAVWWGWKWRCGNVFGTTSKCRDRVKFVRDTAKEVSDAHKLMAGPTPQSMRVERMISWSFPSGEWFKLNTDGASRGNPGLAAAGGVVRDAEGNWCSGFALNIGICSAPLAELWGVYYGLYIAWERGITRLELEVDSEIVVDFLTTGIEDSHPLSFLVRLCYGFLSKDWIVRISHVFREANRLADGLANYAFSLSLGFHMLHACPDDVRLILVEDANGTARPRQIRL